MGTLSNGQAFHIDYAGGFDGFDLTASIAPELADRSYADLGGVTRSAIRGRAAQGRGVKVTGGGGSNLRPALQLRATMIGMSRRKSDWCYSAGSTRLWIHTFPSNKYTPRNIAQQQRLYSRGGTQPITAAKASEAPSEAARFN